MTESDDASFDNLFQEPDDFFQAEKSATFEEHTLKSGTKLNLRLVGHNPLWGHMLWNAGRTVANYLETNSVLLQNKHILEFGAGAGLPSLVCALNGAAGVLVTDYPDEDLVENLRFNIQNCSTDLDQSKITAQGFLWGSDPESLIKHLPNDKKASGYDILILADLLFNHSEHAKLVKSIQDTLSHSESSFALVFFTPYRPWLLGKDLDFFRVANEAGFVSEKLFEHIMDEVMFEEDPGDETLRRTVYGYKLQWKRG